MMMRVYIV